MVACDKKSDAFEELVETFYNPTSQATIYNRMRNKLGLPDAFRNEIAQAHEDLIILSHYGVQGFYDLRLKKQKHITRFYGYDLSRTVKADRRWKARYDKLFEEGDAFIVEGPSMKNILSDLGCAEQKIDICFLGTNVQEITFKKREETNTLNVLIACATAERKGIIYALRAIEKAINKYQIPIHIQWVGGRNSEYPEYIKYESLLHDFIASTNLQQDITRHGFLKPDQLQAVAQQCHLAIHPSVWATDGDCEGGYPVVLLDLMASGLPVISTTHCDIPEVVTDENGYLCPEKNVDALVAALLDAYQNKTYIEKSVLSRKTVEEKFDWNILGPKLSEIILR